MFQNITLKHFTPPTTRIEIVWTDFYHIMSLKSSVSFHKVKSHFEEMLLSHLFKLMNNIHKSVGIMIIEPNISCGKFYIDV